MSKSGISRNNLSSKINLRRVHTEDLTVWTGGDSLEIPDKSL